MTRHPRRSTVALAMFVLVVAAWSGGCSIGPRTMPRDRLDYGHALARSAREEILTNIVRLRYMESPLFMSITSVVNQYSLESTVKANAAWNWGSPTAPDALMGLGAESRFADRPTITYAPMVGRHFTESIVRPVAPEAVLTLIEAGWKVNSLFPLAVHSINGIRNRFYGGASSQALDARFVRIVELLAQMQDDGTISIRVIDSGGDDTKPGFVLMISRADTETERQGIAELKNLLGLDPDAGRYRLVFGSAATDATEIAIVTRSVLAILADMSSYVRVPDQYVADGRAPPGAPLDDGMRHPLVIHSGARRSEDAYVAVRHRDLWYWIDDRDLTSKRTFTILQLVATLAESPDAAQTPLLTIPAG